MAPPRSRIVRTASRHPRKVPSRLTAMVCRHSSSVVCSTVPKRKMPAELTRMSTAPSRDTHSRIAAAQSSSRVTSWRTKNASGPIPRAASAPRSSSRSVIATRAPSATNRCAVASPIPDAPPVTSAALPARRPPALDISCFEDMEHAPKPW